MPYCKNCGREIEHDAKFCPECGTPVKEQKNNAERKQVYEGKIHKCPNCGEVLETFVTHCPSCGYEVRGIYSANSVKEFAEKLGNIEARQMPAFEEKKSVMKMILGKDLKKEDEVEEAQERFEEQKNQEKATLIINYSVPNTKEDILEFMILASSNIDVEKGIHDEVTKAWIVKLEQVYQRAEISMRKNADFMQIKNIYDQKKKEIKDSKHSVTLGIICVIVGYFFLFGFLLDPVITIGIAITLIILVVIGIILLKLKYNGGKNGSF